ncbi:MAG TPA: hypothetical protein PL131_08795 [Methylotenera sp.]|nr:hypothetical protein [Methylotenera sp.]HPH05957.1 hypothetical protein [Methylotenera sp.]HPN00535.1 hypothetical protein [Methylotenera sp.]
MPEIRCKKVLFYSSGDEEIFFNWAKSIPAIKDVFGESDEIILSVKSAALDDDSLRELIALLHRYKLPLHQLAKFKNEKNQDWFSNEKKFWYNAVFINKDVTVH